MITLYDNISTRAGCISRLIYDCYDCDGGNDRFLLHADTVFAGLLQI